ncbi:hypothetical protein EVAR_176_1 [Eumeta japonica]|uniref:Uncharacterized protein n=1 Tax=Eumeta variegata TaxID=151549 RepID=A0A4C1SC22_EUMVA|nr:hypothetical protein EVAR_176_1 [Eumeta japonica]
MYGSGSWVWQKKIESKISAVEMQSLHGMCGVSRKDRCRNSDVRERYGWNEDVVTREERRETAKAFEKDKKVGGSLGVGREYA